jgi:hypothetical protein
MPTLEGEGGRSQRATPDETNLKNIKSGSRPVYSGHRKFGSKRSKSRYTSVSFTNIKHVNGVCGARVVKECFCCRKEYDLAAQLCSISTTHHRLHGLLTHWNAMINTNEYI